MRTNARQPTGNGVNANQEAPSTPLRGRWLLAARAGWVAVAALILGLVTAGFAVGLHRPELIHPQSAQDALAQAQVPGQVTVVAGLMVPMAVFATTGLVIFWRRSDDWAALLFALTLVTGSGYSMRAVSALERAVPALQLPARFVWLLATLLYLIILFVFPDGRFVPRWTRVLGAAAGLAAVVLSADLARIFVELPDVPPGVSEARFGLAVLVWTGFWGAGIYAQAYRYRHVSGPAQRQQTKWIALSLGLLFGVLALGFVLPSLFIDTANAWFAWAALATVPVVLLFPASVAIAILRHHLYDIDRLLSRTLAYGLLTVVLGVLYAGAVLLGQALNPRGGDSTLAVAASTLLVAALFQPLRRRIQNTVDRRFNRRRYDAANTIEAFSARLREQLDLDTLSAELLGVVDQTMQPTKASLWIRRPTSAPRDHGDAAAHRSAARPTGA
jgi:hypothetical protein